MKPVTEVLNANVVLNTGIFNELKIDPVSMPLNGVLPDKKVVEQVKKAHEGGIDGSLGWNYSWSSDDASKVLLRTHTTNLSARKLREIASSGEFPAKYFALGKVFRNETVDWSHLFEFQQFDFVLVVNKHSVKKVRL